MEEKYLTPEEKKYMLAAFRKLLVHTHDVTEHGDIAKVRHIINEGIHQNHYRRDRYGINPTVHNLSTALALCEMISPDRNMIIAILLFNLCKTEFIPEEELVKEWGDDIAKLIRGL